MFKTQAQEENSILNKNVHVFDGTSTELSEPKNVLIADGKIETISTSAIKTDQKTQIINGKGNTLMPGLIDFHVDMILEAFTLDELFPLILQRSINWKKRGN